MKSILIHRFDETVGHISLDVLFLFISTEEIDENSLSQTVEEQINKNVLPDQILILVRESTGTKLVNAFSEETSVLFALKDRLGKQTCVTVISYDITGLETHRHLISGIETTDKICIERLKRRLLTHIFIKNGGLINSSPHYHFRNPSGRHTESFMRLSNVLSGWAEVSFVAFCVLPKIQSHHSIVYIDTPSLFSVVASLNEQLRSFDKERTFLYPYNFQSYNDVEIERLSGTQDSIAFISASNTGKLSLKLEEIAGFSRDQIHHIYFLGTATECNVICNLSKDKTFNPDGYLPKNVEEAQNCRMCKAGSKAIPLQGDQFDIAGPQLEPLIITKDDHQKRLDEIICAFSGTSVFTVGLGESGDFRQFNIDDEKLLQSRSFRERFDNLIDRRFPARCRHIICTNKSSICLGEYIRKRVNLQTAVALVQRDEIKTIGSVKTPIVVLAATIESGRNLQDVGRELRSCSPDAPLVYLVGIAKTTAEGKRTLSNTLSRAEKASHIYEHLEEFVLPNSSFQNPWIQELRLLQTPTFTNLLGLSEKEIIEKRKFRLEKTSTPLVQDLFVSNSGKQSLKLSRGFTFWNGRLPKAYSQGDVFYTISSVLQFLRKEKIKNNWFQQTLLDPENFTRFNDGIIQASFLRSAQFGELNFSANESHSQFMKKIIQRTVQKHNSTSGEAAAEFMLAIATKRLTLKQADLSELADIKVMGKGNYYLKAMVKACKNLDLIW